MLIIPEQIAQEILAHARAAAPVEACGLLAGREGRVEAFHPMTNADNSAEHFSMKPEEQFDAQRKMRAQGHRLLAVYHSHPATPARPSEEDVRLALTPDVYHLIVSLMAPDRPDIKAFSGGQDGMQPAPLKIENATRDRVFELPGSVITSIRGFRDRVGAFVRGEVAEAAFRPERVTMGVYEHRTAGRYMVRVRIGAGRVRTGQLRRIAQLARSHGNGVPHLTTRQDIQIHDVAIEDVPDVLDGLLDAGLSSRGGGGNTVRNVSACPRAGVCPREAFDVSPYALATAEWLLEQPDSFNLPRKFKIAFSGCAEDCAFASVADLGFFAEMRDGRRGFRVLAGGGLGPNARGGILLEEFLSCNDTLLVAEAVKRLFQKHGDRANRRRARLRYVLERLGDEGFHEAYQREKAQLAAQEPALSNFEPDGATDSAESQQAHFAADLSEDVLAEKQPGFFTMRLRLPLGDIPSDDLMELADIAEQYGDDVLRTTQLQDLLITGVRAEDVPDAQAALAGLTINVDGARRPKIVVCAGASTCKLGLCLSRNLAGEISKRLGRNASAAQVQPERVVRISGCPNGCGSHQIADIGLEGRAVRVGGKLMPCYAVCAGAHLSPSGARLAETLGVVPAKRVPELIERILADGIALGHGFQELVSEFAQIPRDIPTDWYRDFGADEPFSLAGRGPGECGAGVLDVVKIDIQEAKTAAAAAKKCPEDVDALWYAALLCSARALLPLFGVQSSSDRETFAQFEQHLVKGGWVEPDALELIAAAVEWRMGDRTSFAEQAGRVDAVVKRAEALFDSLDGQLDFTLPKLAASSPNAPAGDTPETKRVDLRGVACPLNFVKAKVAIEKIGIGDIIEIMLDGGEPVQNVPASLAEQRQQVLEVRDESDYFVVRVRRSH